MTTHILTKDSIVAAKALVSRLCDNGHVRMSVPVDFARDEDMLICALINAAEKSLAPTGPAEDGYATAFYEIASVLGIGARADSPENVFRNEMLPRIVALASRPAAPAQPEAQEDEPLTWRCFHCEEVFTTRDEAREHFGSSEMQSPACQIDIAEYRAMEARMRSYNDEDAEIYRTMYRMQGEHAQALIREEEKGYARALKDTGYVEPAAGAAAPAEVAPSRDEIRREAFEEAAKEPRAYAEMLDKGGWGNRFPDELCAIFNASTNMAERIRALAAGPKEKPHD